MKVYDAKVEETYRHLKTGEVFKERKEWVDKGYKARRNGTGRESYHAAS